MFRIRVTIAALISLNTYGQYGVGTESKRFLLHAEVAPQAAPVGTPGYLHVRLRNMSADTIELGDTNGYFDFWFTVTDEDNREVPKTGPDHRDVLLRSTRMTLEPGEEQHAVLEVTRIYSLQKAGEYVVHVARQGIWEQTKEGQPATKVASAVPVTFMVTDGSKRAVKEFRDPFSEQAVARLTAINNQAELEVSAYPLTMAFSLHEPGVTELSMQNSSDQPVKLSEEQAATLQHTVRVTRPDGTVVHHFKPDRDVKSSYAYPRSIPAGGIYRLPLLLNAWEPFEQTGEYLVEITTPRSHNNATVKVIVTPREPDRLKALCADLAAKAARYDDASTRSLFAINDDIAVPYLLKLAERDIDAIYALGRVDSLVAVEALTSLRKGPLERWVNETLEKLRRQTKNEAVRDAADAALH